MSLMTSWLPQTMMGMEMSRSVHHQQDPVLARVLRRAGDGDRVVTSPGHNDDGLDGREQLVAAATSLWPSSSGAMSQCRSTPAAARPPPWRNGRFSKVIAKTMRSRAG